MKNNFTKILLACLALGGLGTVQAQNEFYNDGAAVHVQAGGLIFVQGDVINDDQGGFVGTMRNLGDIQLTGNWSNTSATSNVFTPLDPGTTTFLGTGAVQTIGGTNTTAFNNLTISKSGGATQEVRQLINSGNDGILNLTNDFLNTQVFGFGVGNVNPSAIQRAGSIIPNYLSSMTEGYVTSTPGSTGRLARATSGAFVNIPYLFPVGNATRFRPVEITPAPGSALNAYFVQFVNLPTPNTNLKAPTLSTVNPAWYHFMERQIPAGSPENIRIYHDFIADNVCDINMVTMAEWNTALWDDLRPQVTSVTSLNPGGFLSWTQSTGYPGTFPTPWVTNQFALGGLFILPGLSSCVFPVEYLSLTATPLETTIMLDWETATEVNNSGFEVHRSTDAVNFEYIGFVQGAGNSASPTAYSLEDRDVVANQRYFYRLRQLDFNGGEAISNTVEAILLKGKDFVVGGFFPNPSDGNVNLWMSLGKDIDFSIEVHDALGKIVYVESRDIDAGYHKMDFDFSKLSAGSYVAHVKLGQEVVMRKLVLQ